MMRSTLGLVCGALLLACGSDDTTVRGGGGGDDEPGGSARDASTRDASRRDASSSDAGRRDASGGGGGGGGSCETQNITARANPPDILIVLDRSLSMQLSFRWAPSTAAVKMLATEYERVVQFGLMTFPSGNSICDPGQLDVPVAPMNASAINGYIDMTLPTGFTPTAETLKQALVVLGDRKVVADSIPTPANVLLVTDGEPQCPGGPDQRQGSIDAVTALAEAGIKTYVVGYDLAQGAALMNELAQIGGTDRYYEVQNQQDLSDAFAEITKDIVRCEYELAEEPDDPSYVRVTIDGNTVELNAADGWVLDGKKITLQSGSCDILKDGANHALQVKVECDPIIYL